MKKCVILDDDQAAISVVVHLLLSQPSNLTVVATYNNVEEALDYLNKHNDIDILFLDVHLPQMSGFAFLDVLKTRPKVILTSSDKNLALTAYDFDLVVDYLVKPLQKDRFIQAINQC